MISIVVADEQQILLEGLSLLLETQPEFKVIAHARSNEETKIQIAKFKPDILILDIITPEVSGLEFVRSIKRISPETKLIILTMCDRERWINDALRAGISGYILKKDSLNELTNSIYLALSGQLYLSPRINTRIIQDYLDLAKDIDMDNPIEQLTEREREVFFLVIKGKNNRKIAESLSISVRTVEMHRRNLMKKMGINNQRDLIIYAARHSLI
jgi:two-component system response regulator NreC